jgi:hypothetical protein
MTRQRWGLTKPAVTGLAALAVALAGCGGNGPNRGAAVAHIGTTTTTTPSSTAAGSTAAPPGATSGAGAGAPGNFGAKAIEFTKCMRSHGVAGFPMPVVNGKSISIRLGPGAKAAPTFTAAMRACNHLLPAKGTSQPITVADQRDYLKAAQCMRDHGFADFPDPVFSGGGVRFTLPPDINKNSPTVAAAITVCQKLIPTGLPYSGTN